MSGWGDSGSRRVPAQPLSQDRQPGLDKAITRRIIDRRHPGARAGTRP